MESAIGPAALICASGLFSGPGRGLASAGGRWPPTFFDPLSGTSLGFVLRYSTAPSYSRLRVPHGFSRENGPHIEENGLKRELIAQEGILGYGVKHETNGGGAVRAKSEGTGESDQEVETAGYNLERVGNITLATANTIAVDVPESQVYKCDLKAPVGNNEVDGTSGRAFNFGLPSAEERERRVAAAWEHWKELGAPKLILAPMVDQSELPFRMLCRKYGAVAAYTPMLHSRVFLEDRNYRVDEFSTCEEDRPLLVQFCANDPETLLQAALQVQSQCDYVDINLGCPQRTARRGNYGAFLMDDLPLIHSLVSHLASNLSVPVSCKIRIFPELEDTVAYARMLEAAGCSLLAVHGRTRDQKFNQFVQADWNAIRAVKEAVRIPVLANGNIRWLEDVEACMAATGADGVLSAESLLENPALFAGYRRIMNQDPTNPCLKIIDERVLCLEYLDLVQQYPVPMRMVLRHMFKLLTSYWFQHHRDLRDELHSQQYKLSLDYLRDFLNRLIARGPPLFSPYKGEEFPDARPPRAELPVIATEPASATALYIPNIVERNRLMRMIRRRPSKKIKLPDWISGQTTEPKRVGA